MEYVNLGSTGLRVSRVCLGMMSYGQHESRPWALDEAAAEPIVRRAVEGGDHLLRHRGRLQRRSERGRHRPRCCSGSSACARSTCVATKVHGRTMPGENGARSLAQAHPRLDRRVAAAARARLRRPLPDPPLGPADADRGDDGGAARRREGGQGALHRRQQHVRLAVRQGRSASRRRGSCRCRTTTTWSTARRSGR